MVRRVAWVGTRVDTALFAGCVVLAFLLKASSESVRDGLAGFLRHTILAPVFSLQASAEKWRNAVSSYDAVVASRDSAVIRILELQTYEAENARLADLMLLGRRLKSDFIPARVLHNSSPGNLSTVTIMQGSCSGVKPRSPVLSADGLVGVVKSVDCNTSVVSLWTDPDFAVAAMSEDRSAFGIVTPHVAPGADGYLLELRNVEFRHALRTGTRIVAAGTGGVYPAGTPIGTVIDTLVSGAGWARTYLIRPAVKAQDLSAVLILDPSRAAQGLQGVWASPAQVDSSTRVLVAKADSIARMREQAILKAQVDSATLRIKAGGGDKAQGAVTVPPPSQGKSGGG